MQMSCHFIYSFVCLFIYFETHFTQLCSPGWFWTPAVVSCCSLLSLEVTDMNQQDPGCISSCVCECWNLRGPGISLPIDTILATVLLLWWDTMTKSAYKSRYLAENGHPGLLKPQSPPPVAHLHLQGHTSYPSWWHSHSNYHILLYFKVHLFSFEFFSTIEVCISCLSSAVLNIHSSIRKTS